MKRSQLTKEKDQVKKAVRQMLDGLFCVFIHDFPANGRLHRSIRRRVKACPGGNAAEASGRLCRRTHRRDSSPTREKRSRRQTGGRLIRTGQTFSNWITQLA